MCDTYNCDNLQHNTFRFNLIDFQLYTDFPSQFKKVIESVLKHFLPVFV